jgi:hypothetical protein
VLLLLAVTDRLLQGLHDERSGGGDNLAGSLTVLDSQLDGDADSLPVLGSLCNIFGDLLWGLLSAQMGTTQRGEHRVYVMQ